MESFDQGNGDRVGLDVTLGRQIENWFKDPMDVCLKEIGLTAGDR